MNKGIIRYILGRILLVEAGLMVFPVIIGLIFGEGMRTIGSFIAVIAMLVAFGLAIGVKKPASTKMYIKEGLAAASLSWFILSFFGGLPFCLSGEIPSLVDAFFEASSGFTTTGSSVVRNVEALSHSILFWRSFSHLIGGMGVLVFALALLPNLTAGSVNIMKAEVPGPVFGKLMSKLRDTARILYLIYFVMTAVLIILLMLGGMNWFEASLHAFGAAGTGGFGIKNASVGFYNSTYIDYVLGVAMLAFGVNFNIYYLILIGQVNKAFRNEELRWYLAIAAGAVVLICINVFPMYNSIPRMIRDVFFTVSSIQTTTGFATADFGTWPVFSHAVLLGLMFFGACAGSTAGGLKISRVGILFKSILAELRASREPNRVLSVRFEDEPLSRDMIRSVAGYFVVYMGFFSFSVLLISLDSPDFLTAFSAVAATFNNIGPGLSMVGPTASFADFSGFSKLLLSVGMIAGRLEIYPVMVLFMPSTWRRRI